MIHHHARGLVRLTPDLEDVDTRCGALDDITGNGCVIETDVVTSNNFAFGGANPSLVFRRWS